MSRILTLSMVLKNTIIDVFGCLIFPFKNMYMTFLYILSHIQGSAKIRIPIFNAKLSLKRLDVLLYLTVVFAV